MTLTNIRHDWYQNDGSITVDIFAKNILEDSLKVQFEVGEFCVSFSVISGEKYERRFQTSRPITPFQCFYTLTGTKLEIHLHKAETEQWKTLEAEASEATQTSGEYPSSARQKCDWSKLESELKTDKADNSGTVEEFFQKLYADASDDTRRAMTKSFVESQGTVLSTNWDKVGKDKVKPVPPK